MKRKKSSAKFSPINKSLFTLGLEIFSVAGRRILINSVTKKQQHSLLIYDFIVLLNTHAKEIENNKLSMQ